MKGRSKKGYCRFQLGTTYQRRSSCHRWKWRGPCWADKCTCRRPILECLVDVDNRHVCYRASLIFYHCEWLHSDTRPGYLFRNVAMPLYRNLNAQQYRQKWLLSPLSRCDFSFLCSEIEAYGSNLQNEKKALIATASILSVKSIFPTAM